MPELKEEKILGSDWKSMSRKENIADFALLLGSILFVCGIFIPLLLVPGSIIFSSGVVATAIKVKK
jgi:hypothetical protein